MYKDGKFTSHTCGIYFQDVPTDPLTGLSAVPYDVAEELGYFKIDFLHLYVYDHFSSREEIRELMKLEPDWTLLEIPSVVAQLFQLGKHFDTISQVKPKSIIELADCISLIRPQKKFLMKYYLQNREKTRRDHLYNYEDGEGYAFKKAHAVAYAFVIVLQLHLIKAGII